MIGSTTVILNEISEPADLARESREIKEKVCETVLEESERNKNIADTTGVTFKAVVSLLFFIFLCAILAATLSNNVANVIGKDGVVAAHYLATHSDKFTTVFR